MATLTISLAINTEAGARLRRLGAAIQDVANDLPDNVSSGAATVLTITDSPLTVQVTGGPYAGAARLV
jgi:hypothetical protein